MSPFDYTWLFAIGIVLAFMDAFGIGSNDVANAFSTSIGSRSITLKQACFIAIFTEFGGAILMGAETTETVKGNIIDITPFIDNPELLMLGFVCALAGSSFWVLTASKYGWPVSTSHSIIAATVGFGVASFGVDGVDWGWSGMAKIFASWLISPVAAGLVASFIYLSSKYLVMARENSFKRGLIAVPIYFTLTIAISTMYVVLKGGKSIKLTSSNTAVILGSVIGVSLLFGLFAVLCVVPWMRRKLEEEETLYWYQVFYIFALPKQPRDENLHKTLSKYGQNIAEQKSNPSDNGVVGVVVDKIASTTASCTITKDIETRKSNDTASTTCSSENTNTANTKDVVTSNDSKGKRNFWGNVKYYALKGLNTDIAATQSNHVAQVHSYAQKFENRTEYLYSFLQVLTASFASFAHGSNDVANAIGPLAAIYYIWENGAVDVSKTPVPIWCLAFGGLAIDLGLVLYGYRVMGNLGNNITYHSPSRGFSMELGAALTVITASFIGVPVSTTHCITGATAAVGLCNGDVKALNWKVVGWCVFSWILTVPVTATISGLLFALLTNAPKF